MKYLKKYEGLRDLFRKPIKHQPKDKEEKSVIFGDDSENVKRIKSEREKRGKEEYIKLDDIMSKMDIDNVESIEKIDVQSNPWIQRFIYGVSDRYYVVKVKSDYLISKINTHPEELEGLKGLMI